jgi:tetratricopeptide (TPR) repeat protein
MPLLVASGVRKFTITYLKTKFSRELSADQLEKIQLAEMTRNPLYLTLLLNELRLFGEYEKLTAKIQEYLCAGTISELFKAILTRFEADYASEKPCLIGRLFSALALSRRGLSENELREIAGDPGQAVPAFKWSPIFLASEDALLNQGGRLVPAHNYILQAIHEKYLPDKASEVRVRRKIAAAFENSPDFEPTSVSPRQAEEYPWQLFQMGEYSKLLEFISDPVSFVRLRKSFFPDLKMYWTRLVKWDPRALMARYSATIRSPRGYSNEFKTALAELFFDQGDFEKAAVLRTALLKDSPQDTDQKRHLANIHFHQGHHKKARKCYEALVGQCRESEDAYGLQKALGNQAVVLRHLQKFNQALEILAEQENVCRQLSEARGLMKCYGNRANVYKAQQKFELALEMHRQEEAICQELNDQKALQICYGNQSIAQFELGHRNEAAVLFEKERDICDLLGDDLGLQAALANRGNMLFDKSPDESLKLFQEQLALARKIEYPKGEQNACYNCGMALIQLNRFTEAQDMLTAAKKICKKYDFMPELKLVKWQLNRLRRHCC